MIRSLRSGTALVVFLGLASVPVQGQTPATPAKPKTAAPRPAPQRGPQKAPPKAAAKPASAAPTPVATTPPPAEDLRFKASYTTGERRTESVTYLKGTRQRFEFGDTILIKQPDEKRTVQISTAASSYLVMPDGESAAPIPAADGEGAAKPAGVVVVTTSITDTGERKTLFGLEARRLKTVVDKQPQPGACDQTKQHVETDGWYVDVPKALAVSGPASAPAAPVGGCRDEIKVTQNGDVALAGFPVSYTMTTPGEEGQPNVVTMEVSELEITTLDAGLFDVPPGLTMASNLRELSKAVSDANEKKLAAQTAAPVVDGEKKPGVLRVGVPELTNKTGQEADTRALRERLIAELATVKMDAVPMAAAPQSELLQQASTRGLDYVLVADVTEMKVGGGRFGGVAKAMSKVAGSGQEKPATEASVAWQLLQPDGKVRLSATSKGKDGGGISMKTTLGLARFAGTMYMNFMGGKMMMNAMSSMTAGSLSGMGMLGSPQLGAGAGMGGGGMDPTAGAASFLIQQVMSSSSTDDQPVSFDGSLGEAIGGTAKALGEGLKKKKL
jgi:hypothetical protein